MAKQVKYLTQIVAHLEKKYGAEKTAEIMAAAHARISWDRTKTLGHGSDVCDFKVRIV